MLAGVVPFFEPIFTAVSSLPMDGVVSQGVYSCLSGVVSPACSTSFMAVLVAANCNIWLGGPDGQPLNLLGYQEDFSYNVTFQYFLLV